MTASAETPQHASPRILVVDDEPGVRTMLVRVLAEDGYRAWPAADGREALEVAEAIRPDLVLLDLGLPGMEGWDVFEALIRKDPRIAVIVITAKPNQGAAAKAAGCEAFFEKPLDFPALLEAVAKLRLPERASAAHHP